MIDKFHIDLRIRRIDNGYILTGAVHKDGGGQPLPEEFYRNLGELDAAVAERLSGAEKVASEIKPAEHFRPSTILWGPRPGFYSDED